MFSNSQFFQHSKRENDLLINTNLFLQEAAWHKVMNEMNCKYPPRSLENLKSKYDNLKTKARAYGINKYKHARGTGGGPQSAIATDVVLDTVLTIINQKTVVGLQNPFDCDLDDELFQVTGVSDVQESVNIETVSSIELLPTVEILPLEINTMAEENWAKYTPKKLRSKKSPKLVVKSKAGPSEEYLKTRTEYLKKKICSLELQNKISENKDKRDEEEHRIKIQILELELLLKQKEVEKCK